MNYVKLSLKEIEKLNGISVAHLSLKMESNHLTWPVTFQISTAGHNIRIESSHLVGELEILMDWLFEKVDNTTNSIKIIKYSKELIKADKQLNKVLELE